MPRTRRDAREALDVPAHARMVLVSGGGWGIGDLEGAINAALSDGDTLVVCITGRNEVAREKLEQRFGDNEQVRVLGFTEQMSDWMAAADAMIHATAGLTVLEAHIRGCPVVSYGFSAGHLRANNAAFERFGLAEVARSEHELESVLRHVTNERRSPDSSFASLPSIASRVLTARPRVRPQPVWRVRIERVATAVSLAAVAVVMMLAVIHRETPYRVISKPLESRVHFGKDEDAAAATPAAAAEVVEPSSAAVRRPPPLDRAPARRGALGAAGGRPRRARRWRRSCRASARRSGSSCASRGRTGVAITFDDGPHPQGTPLVLEILREAGAPATFFLAGEQVVRRPGAGGGDRRRRPPGRAPLPPAPQPAAAHAAPAARRRRARHGRRSRRRPGRTIHDYRPPYGIFSAAGLRAIRRRGWRPVLWSLWGKDWKRRATARVDRQAGDERRRGRRHPAAPRRRLLQRGRLLESNRGGAAAHTRGARRPGAEGRFARAAEAAVPESTGRNPRTLRRAFSPSCCAAGPGRRSPWA